MRFSSQCKYQRFKITVSTALYSNGEELRWSRLSNLAYKMLILNSVSALIVNKQMGFGTTVLILGSFEAEEMIFNDDSGKCDRKDL